MEEQEKGGVGRKGRKGTKRRREVTEKGERKSIAMVKEEVI